MKSSLLAPRQNLIAGSSSASARSFAKSIARVWTAFLTTIIIRVTNLVYYRIVPLVAEIFWIIKMKKIRQMCLNNQHQLRRQILTSRDSLEKIRTTLHKSLISFGRIRSPLPVAATRTWTTWGWLTWWRRWLSSRGSKRPSQRGLFRQRPPLCLPRQYSCPTPKSWFTAVQVVAVQARWLPLSSSLSTSWTCQRLSSRGPVSERLDTLRNLGRSQMMATPIIPIKSRYLPAWKAILDTAGPVSAFSALWGGCASSAGAWSVPTLNTPTATNSSASGWRKARQPVSEPRLTELMVCQRMAWTSEYEQTTYFAYN